MARSLKARAKFLAVACVVARTAAANPSPSDLQARGEQLAKDGRYADAIDAFKAADKLEVRASHACLIALAYTRRELWPQAEVWLDTCEKRVRADDPLPDWGHELEATIAQRLAETNVAPVVIRVLPGDTTARLTLSSFAPDETFAARTIHLPPGHYVIAAKAPGFADAQVAFDIADRTEQRVTVVLERQSNLAASHTLLLAGVGFAIAGGGTYAWMSYEWLRENRATTHRDYLAPHTSYEYAKWATLGLWSVGAACIITRVVLGRRSATEVAAVPLDGGVLVGIAWQR